MTPRETIRDLAEHVKSAVVPHLGEWRSRRITGIASSGDTTFDIDDIAEEAVAEFIRDRGLNVCYYSEDRGLIRPDGVKSPDGVLIIDPIDGTRGAIANLESCVVSVAWADYSEKPTLGVVSDAGITEIKGNLSFSSERGCGVQITNGSGQSVEPFRAPTTEIDKMGWSLGMVGAPSAPLYQVVGSIVDRTTVAGGFFVLNSSAFELTRLVTGQLAAAVDVRNRLLKDYPETREAFIKHGLGRLLSLYGYDVAGAANIALEAGCVVTDAWGRSLSDWELLDTSEANFGSFIAASNAELHAKLVEEIDRGFAEFGATVR